MNTKSKGEKTTITEGEIDSLVITRIKKNHEEERVKNELDYSRVIEEAKERLENRNVDAGVASMMELGTNLNSSSMSYTSRNRGSMEKIQFIARLPIEFLQVKNVNLKNIGGNRTGVEQDKKKKREDLNMSVQPVIKKEKFKLNFIGTKKDDLKDDDIVDNSFGKSPMLNRDSNGGFGSFSFQQKNVTLDDNKQEENIDKEEEGYFSGKSYSNKDEKKCSCGGGDFQGILSKYHSFLNKIFSKKNKKLESLVSDMKIPCDKCYGHSGIINGQNCRYCDGSGVQIMDHKTEILMELIELKLRTTILKPLEVFLGLEKPEEVQNEEESVESVSSNSGGKEEEGN